MNKKLGLMGIILSTLFLWGCDSNGNEECLTTPDVATSVHVDITHLEQEIATIETKDQLVNLLTANPILRDYMLGRKNYPSDSVFINNLFERFTHPAFDSLLIETQRIFGTQEQLQEQLDEAFSHLKSYYPSVKIPKVVTVITGLENDLFVTDSLIMIGLDYYLGKDAKYRPQLYEYLLMRYEPEDIVPSCMLLYGIGEFNKTDMNDRTVIADMIAFGKSFYFAKHMLPCIPDSTFLWYTSSEMEGARANQDLVWARFVEDKILFSTSHITKQKFLGERPKTLEVGEQCPGRIAQWIGWEIVKSFMETHPNVTLPQLMDNADARGIFQESGYQPHKR